MNSIKNLQKFLIISIYILFSEQNIPESVDRAPQPLPSVSQNPCGESNTQMSAKLKLQLFPIDDSTRRALEMVRGKWNYSCEVEWSLRSWAVFGNNWILMY